jgi:hypothetical protein
MSKLTDYKPLTRNPNKGTQRGTGILEQSVRELGAGRSILVDKNGVILAGNHAQEAFVNAGMDDVIEVETDGKQIVVVKRTDLDADSSAGKKMAIMDNRTSEQGLAWDAVVVEDLLNEIKQDEGELDNYLNGLAEDVGLQNDDKYSRNIEAPIYKPSEIKPTINELYDNQKSIDLIKEIDNSSLPEDEKEFLRVAALRHIVLNYKRIADYYAHSSEQVQKLMEDSALIIIDFDKAIELGYVKLSRQIAEQYLKDYGDEK